MTDPDWATWTTEDLIAYEERLYDQEIAGEDAWFERDKIIRELTARRSGCPKPEGDR